MEEDFSYKKLKTTWPQDVAEGGFGYEKFTPKENLPSDGSWFETPWFDDWFGSDEDFTYRKV